MRKITVAAIQMNIAKKNWQGNLSKALSLIDAAASGGANIVCLPELFTTGFDYEYIKTSARPTPNETTTAISKKAQDLGIFVVAGSIPVKSEENIYNTVILFDNNGEIIGKFSKLHLFPLMHEDKHFTAGNELPVFNTSLGQIGIMVCYDLRFPEVARQLTLAGAEIIFVPAEFPQPRLEHWKTLLRARAIENQIYIVGVNRVGNDNSNTFFGHSCIIDPWGEVLVSSSDKEDIINAEIDISKVYEVRKQLPCLDNRRSKVYYKGIQDMSENKDIKSSARMKELEKELRKLSGFVLIYCKDHHGATDKLCEDCQDLLDYAIARRKLCPLDTKPECKNCHIHCYKPEQREKIRQVMRYAGPRFYKMLGQR